MRIVIPVKPLSSAKTRLSPVLSPSERVQLMLSMFDHVVGEAMAVAKVTVVTPDDFVARRAAEAGASVVLERVEAGLNAAADCAADVLRCAGETRMLFLAADLPALRSAALATFACKFPANAAAIAPSHDGRGTNALAIPLSADFDFGFGPDSFRRHLASAARIGLRVNIHRCALLGADIDTPADLDLLNWPRAA